MPLATPVARGTSGTGGRPRGRGRGRSDASARSPKKMPRPSVRRDRKANSTDHHNRQQEGDALDAAATAPRSNWKDELFWPVSRSDLDQLNLRHPVTAVKDALDPYRCASRPRPALRPRRLDAGRPWHRSHGGRRPAISRQGIGQTRNLHLESPEIRGSALIAHLPGVAGCRHHRDDHRQAWRVKSQPRRVWCMLKSGRQRSGEIVGRSAWSPREGEPHHRTPSGGLRGSLDRVADEFEFRRPCQRGRKSGVPRRGVGTLENAVKKNAYPAESHMPTPPVRRPT